MMDEYIPKMSNSIAANTLGELSKHAKMLIARGSFSSMKMLDVIWALDIAIELLEKTQDEGGDE